MDLVTDEPHGETLDLATQRDLTNVRYFTGESEVAPPAGHPAPVDSQPPTVTDNDRLTVAEAAIDLGIDPDYLLTLTKDLIDEARQGTPVYDRDGTLVGSSPQLNTALRGVELLMKATGLLAEHRHVEHTGGIEIRIAAINPDNLT